MAKKKIKIIPKEDIVIAWHGNSNSKIIHCKAECFYKGKSIYTNKSVVYSANIDSLLIRIFRGSPLNIDTIIITPKKTWK